MSLHAGLMHGEYDGELVDGRFQGRGTYTLPEGKGKYIGEFFNNEFHGEGTMYIKGGKYLGTWEKGRLVKGNFVFDDGLAHRPVDRKFWEYCSEEDPRFYCEILEGHQPGKTLKYETALGHNTTRLPPGCYDTLDNGYYDPKKLSICSLETMEPTRMVDKEEKEWILRSCRVQQK
jgi:hypothetical protein